MDKNVKEPSIAIEMAQMLFDLQCVQLSPLKPFTYASGLQGPIYCDNRQILSFPLQRNKVLEHFERLLRDQSFEFDLLGGIATAGIPYASILADRMGRPMIYVRGKSKGHGKKNQVEGFYRENDRVLLFEDLVNQGSSLADALDGLMQAKLRPMACCCIVDYQMPEAQKVLIDYNISLYSLTNFSALVSWAQKSGQFSEREIGLLQEWHRSPKDWQAPT